MNYEIFTDSSCNLTDEMIEELDIKIVSLVFIVDGVEYVSYVKGRDSNLEQYYTMLREKKNITTSCVNYQSFIDSFEEVLEQGKDILYLGFSSGLSLTFENGRRACEDLKAKYPDRKIIAVDTLSASMGEGLSVFYAAKMRLDGKSIEEVAEYVENTKLKVNHFFTVEDLYWLYKGGRVTKTAFLMASVAKIKPVMHVDDNGKLVAVGKVLGRKKSLLWIVDRVCEIVEKCGEQYIFISHGDCKDDVEFVKSKIRERVSVKAFYENYVDPVVGAHSGPGTMALFAIGDTRNIK